MAVRLFPLFHGPYMDRHPLQRYNLVSDDPKILREIQQGGLQLKEEERQKNSRKASKRRTKILTQTPSWLTKEQLE